MAATTFSLSAGLPKQHEDISLLVKYFLDVHQRDHGLAHAGFELDAIELLRQQPWPGNVRELANVILQALLIARGATVTRTTIVRVLSRKDMGSFPRTMSKHIAEVLAQCH